MYDKYDTRTFFWKVLKRFVLFSGLGLFLTFWCEFPISIPLVFDSEILMAIGLNLLFLSLWFYVPIKNKFVHACWFFGWSVIMILLNQVFHINTSFNVFWILSFMFFGVGLAYLGDKSSFLIAGIFLFGSADYYQRNIEFWLLNCGIMTLLLVLSKYLQKIEVLSRFFSYFGKHPNALFFYVMHFAVFRRLLLSTGYYQKFGIFESITLTFCSIAFLVALNSFYASSRRARVHFLRF